MTKSQLNTKEQVLKTYRVAASLIQILHQNQTVSRIVNYLKSHTKLTENLFYTNYVLIIIKYNEYLCFKNQFPLVKC